MKLSIIILAAGKGKRMRTELPKVLHQLGGKTLLEHVYDTAKKLDENIYVVYGFGAEEVLEKNQHLAVTWVKQDSLQGTGHAVLQALPQIPDDHHVLVLVGDSPLVSLTTLRRLLDVSKTQGVGLVTTRLDDPTGFGRILHDQTEKVLGIVEERDATAAQKRIKEINSGIITAPAKELKRWLPKLKNTNAQGEYYLTDIIEYAAKKGITVKSVMADSSNDVLGINDRIQLAKLERIYQRRQAEQLMLRGVSLLDPERLDVRGELDVERDVVIDVNVILEGQIRIGYNSKIGPNCYLKNVSIGNNVEILANTILEDAVIEDYCKVGPFARIRPGTHLKENVKIGNFVEIKKTQIDCNSKVNHLSYMGDAIIGKDVNVGAGCITCNYDGVNKHKTIIKDGAFIGSNSQLIAPIEIGEGAYIGSGSTISKNAPANQLTLSRAKQTTIKAWKKPTETQSKTGSSDPARG